jgi:hypothetical protein
MRQFCIVIEDYQRIKRLLESGRHDADGVEGRDAG